MSVLKNSNQKIINKKFRFFFHHAHCNCQMIEGCQTLAINNFHFLIIDVVFDVQQVGYRPKPHYIENYIFLLCLFF